MTVTDVKIGSGPADGITRVQFSPFASQQLIASSWDGTVRLYDTDANVMKTSYAHDQAVLDCCWQDTSHVFSGGLDCQLKMFDVTTGQETVIGRHDKAVRCVEFSPDTNLIITGSWDQAMKLWDPRASGGATSHCIGSHSQPDKVYTMSACGDMVIVGTAGRRVIIWDLRNPGYVHQRRESSLKYQTRCIRSFPNKQGYILSSIEGRVAVEYMDVDPEVQKKKYAFKCHRMKVDGQENIYPVHAISFHPIFNTFATGGGDGNVNMWDGFNKKRLCQFQRYPASISSLSFNKDGTHLAIASSPMEDQKGEKSELQAIQRDEILIKRVSDTETKPK